MHDDAATALSSTQDDTRDAPLILRFMHGTLLLNRLPEGLGLEHLCVWDPRAAAFRAWAERYGPIAQILHKAGFRGFDKARQFAPISLEIKQEVTPYPHQAKALEAWLEAQGRGVVVLPTGAGKTILAHLAIAKKQRPTLVVVPTIDLVHQWADGLASRFGVSVGLLGGGSHQIEDLTVSTYDSAALHMEYLGSRFGFLVCDEAHHLPAASYRFIAQAALAPYRLGLTATPERTDQGEEVMEELLGEVVYRIRIRDLAGTYLAPYTVERVDVMFTPEEADEYSVLRDRYLTFLRQLRIDFRNPGAWGQFIAMAHRSEEGRAAFAAYRRQRQLALSSSGKMDALWEIILRHKDDSMVVFTQDNATAYAISERFFVPVITHNTSPAERKALLEGFRGQKIPVLVTSRVLNEGVDVPEARVGVILSGSGSVRDHVQRLGRILRPRPGKKAVLYEICTAESGEGAISERRRQHHAFGHSPGLLGGRA